MARVVLRVPAVVSAASVTIPGSCRADEPDPDPSNNTREKLFPFNQVAAPFDLAAQVTITSVPTSATNGGGAAFLMLMNNGQHIAEDVSIRLTAPLASQSFVGLTADRPGDTVFPPNGETAGWSAKAPLLRPGESAGFELTFLDTSETARKNYLVATTFRPGGFGTLSLPDSDPSNDQAAAHYAIGGNARIEGSVYIDTNGNGTKDPGETGAANADVTHTDSTRKQITVKTNASANFAVEDVFPGDGMVSVNLIQQGMMAYANFGKPVQTTPGGTITVVIPLSPVAPPATPGEVTRLFTTGTEGGVTQHWMSFHPDWTPEVSENLSDWKVRPGLRSPVLLNPDYRGALPQPPALYFRARRNF